MFQAFSRLFVLIASASIVVGNGTQIIDWHALNDAEPNQDDSQIRLILYNRKWREGTSDMSHLKKKLHTFVLIHGFNDNLKDSIMLPLLTKNYLDREKCSVVVVDWAEFAKGPWFINAAKNTLLVGKQLAAWLDTSGLDMRRVTLVGFSMGAHVAGDAGHFAKKRVSRIVALDPAHFLFQNSPPEFRLDSTDAEIVEVVHTSGGYVGEKDSLGTRDFFPNGGTYPQPGCSPDPTGTCSHRRAYYYYSEAISRPDDNFRGRRCNSFEHFVKHKCREKGKPVILHLVNTNRDKLFTGNFYFMTNSKEPFIRRNVSDNATLTTEKHPTTAGKHLMTEVLQVTVDKHRTTKDKQQLEKYSTTSKGLTTMNKIRPTTGKRHASPIESSKDSSTPTSKHRTTIGKHQTTTAIAQTIPDKRRMSTDKNQMTIDKYQSPDKYWVTTGKHHKTTEKHYASTMDSTKNSSTATSKHRTTVDKHQTSMDSSKYSSTASPKHRTTLDKHRVTADKHQTITDKHHPAPTVSSKYSSTGTFKYQTTMDKHRTSRGVLQMPNQKYQTASDKSWTIMEILQTTTDKHRRSTHKRRTTTEKHMTSTNKRNAAIMDFSKYIHFPKSKHRTKVDVPQKTTNHWVIADKHQTTTDKHHPTPMVSSKYSSAATSKLLMMADKHRTTIGIDQTPTEKHGMAPDKNWTIMGLHLTTTDKRQMPVDKRRAATEKPHKTTGKHQATADKHQTTTDKHHPTPMGSSKYSSAATSKHRMMADKHRTTIGIDQTLADKHGTNSDKHGTTDKRYTSTDKHRATSHTHLTFTRNCQRKRDKHRTTTFMKDVLTHVRNHGQSWPYDDE